MAAACSGPNVHSVDGGQLDSEEGVGILDRLRNHTGDPVLEQRSTLLPVEAACGGHEHGKRARVVTASVCLEHRAGGFQERTAERQRHQRRLQQSERVHLLGVVEGQLGCDRRAGGVARDVSAPHTELLEQRRGVGGVIGDAHRRRSVGAADPTPLVVPDQLVAVGQCRLCKERHEAVGDQHVDQQHGLPCSAHLVFQVDAVDVYALHGSFSFGAGCCGPQPICVSKAVTAVTSTVTPGAWSPCV